VQLLPEHRALIGVDVVGSASLPGHHRAVVPRELRSIIDKAFSACGLDRSQAVEREHTGDGLVLVMPSPMLGALVDAADRINTVAGQRNDWSQPDLRLRIAIDVGPVAPPPSFADPKITLNRLLDAAAFKAVVQRCVGENREGAHAGLIVSDAAHRLIFGGSYVSLVRGGEFAPLDVRVKEFAERGWVRIPGFEAKSLFPGAAETAGPVADSSPTGGHIVHNTGVNHGVQAASITGGVVFGGSR